MITDEIYEHLLYDDVDTGSLPVLCPGVRDTCIVVNGVAKTYAMTGWRVGWLIGPPDVVKAATNFQSHATSNVANVAQRAAIAAVEGDLSAVDQMLVAFDRRRKTMVSMLNEIDGVVCPVPQGAFYCYPSVKGLLGRDIDGAVATSSAELAEIFLEKAEVAVVPGEAFGSPGYVRLSYALGDEDLAGGHQSPAEVAGPRGDCSAGTSGLCPKAHLHLHFTGSMRHRDAARVGCARWPPPARRLGR
ncbi:MAG: aminotransferase class I/II-fold pyridoxal phosphate-dependent enzyme [Marmoricola sp.]